MHARGGRTLARAGAWRGMVHVQQSSGDARTHAGRRPGRGQHADCRRRSLVRGGGCADAGSLHVIGSPSRPRGRALGGSGSCAARGARRGLRGQAPAQGRRARGRCLRGRRSRARGGCRAGAWGSGPLRRGTLAQEWACAPAGKAKRVASAARPAPTPPPHRLPHRTPAPAPTPRAARPPPRRPPVRFQRAASAKNKVASSFRAPIPNPRSLVTLAEGVFPESLGELSAGGHCGSRARFWQKRPRRLARSLRGGPEGPAGSFGALRAVPFAASSL